MDLILLMFLLSVLVDLRFSKSPKPVAKYLCIDNSNRLRGIMAISVVLHHMSERVVNGKCFMLLQHAGYLIVAVFFFLSGYGLMFQYKRKGDAYLKALFRKRIPYLLLIYCFYNIVYGAYKILFENSLTIDYLIKSVQKGNPLVSNSWYIIIQIVLYIIFGISFMQQALSTKRRIICVLIGELILNLFLYVINYSMIWYISNMGFVVGVAWAEYAENIDTHKSHIISSVSVLLFVIFSILPPLFHNIRHYDLLLPIARIISTTAFVGMFVTLLSHIQIVGGAWDYLGNVSMELYLIHGLVITILHKFVVFSANDVLWTMASLAISICTTYPLKSVSTSIERICRGTL